jgi:hypothetical protein
MRRSSFSFFNFYNNSTENFADIQAKFAVEAKEFQLILHYSRPAVQ